jgi:hypothetical protein
MILKRIPRRLIMRINLGTGIVIVAVGLLAPFASAADVQTPVKAVEAKPIDALNIDFAAVDKDTDGNLSREEVQVDPGLATSFAMLDADGNGALSPGEFAQWARAGKAQPIPVDPATAPRGSSGAQHQRDRK